MFWGWFSFGDGGMRRGGGCIFLPFLFICGSFFLFDNLNAGWLLGLVIVAVLWMVLPSLLRSGGQPQMEMEKPKRDYDMYDFEDEKPKRDSEYLRRYNGEILEVVDPNEEEEDRPRTGF